jgi:hypothetical protein
VKIQIPHVALRLTKSLPTRPASTSKFSIRVPYAEMKFGTSSSPYKATLDLRDDWRKMIGIWTEFERNISDEIIP